MPSQNGLIEASTSQDSRVRLGFPKKCLDGSYSNDPSQMRQIASEYYDNLLKAQPFSTNDLSKRDIIWSRIQHRVYAPRKESRFNLHDSQIQWLVRGASALEANYFVEHYL